MRILFHFAEVFLPLLYLGLALAYHQYFQQESKNALRVCRVGLPALGLLHLGYLIFLSVFLGRVALGSIVEFMSVLALALLLLYTAMERRYRVKTTGSMVVGLALVFQFLSSAFMGAVRDNPGPLLADGGYILHAVLVLFAYTALSLAFLYSLLYVIQARQLAARSFGLLYRRLPSLDLLERMSVGAVKLGVPLLLAANLAGHGWMHTLTRQLGQTQAADLSTLDAKIFSAWGTLAIYVLGLLGHRYWGWRGRRMSYIAIAAFLLVVVATGVVQHFLPSFHNFNLGAGP